MFKMTRWLVFVVLLILLTALPTAAGGIQAEVDLQFLSSYVWRGGTVTDGAVFQHSLNLSGENSPWNVNIWGNIDLTDANGLRGNYLEVDLTVSYAFELDSGFGADIGLAHYIFPHYSPGETTEGYLSLGWDLPVAPSLTIYYDFGQVNDYYANLGCDDAGTWEVIEIIV